MMMIGKVSEQAPTNHDGTPDEAKLGFRQRFASFRQRLTFILVTIGVGGWIRLFIGLLGVGGFVVGVILAWRANSATTLLIVSAVLLVFAAIGIEWEEIALSWGSVSAALRRQQAVAEIEQVAESDEVPEPVREKLEAPLAELRATTTPSWPRTFSTLRTLRAYDDYMAGVVRSTPASHRFRDEAVELTLRWPLLGIGIRCTVKTPAGRSYSAVTRRPISTGNPFSHVYRVAYPNDFEGSEPLTPGSYEVEWHITTASPSGTPPWLALLMSSDRPVAVDAFTVPEPNGKDAPAEEPAT